MYSDNFVFAFILNVSITVVAPALIVKFPPDVENPALPPPPPPRDDANVIESPAALVVIVILLPATNVTVSDILSATTSLCPVTAIVLNTFTSVKFAPLIAGNAPVSFDAVSVEILASATVPDVKFVAFRFVKLDPLPEKLVAVTSPVILILPVPVIFLLFKLRFPPSSGDVSSTTLEIPPPPPPPPPPVAVVLYEINST